jgi:hypothetical protein
MDDFEEHLSPRKLSESNTRDRGETRLRVGVFDHLPSSFNGKHFSIELHCYIPVFAKDRPFYILPRLNIHRGYHHHISRSRCVRYFLWHKVCISSRGSVRNNCYDSVDLYPNICFRFNSPDQLGQGIPIYLIIFIFSQVFQVFLVLDAVSSQTCVPS